MKRSPSTRLALVAAAVVATLTLASACGDDDDASGTTTAGTDAVATTDGSVATDAGTGSTDAGTGSTDVGSSTPASGSGVMGSQDDYIAAAEEEIGWDDEEINTCAAEAIVSDDVFAALQDANVTIDAFREGDLSGKGVTIDQDQADSIASDMAACGDLIPQIVVSEDEQACVSASFDNDLMAEYLVLALFGLPASEEASTANDEVAACMSE